MYKLSSNRRRNENNTDISATHGNNTTNNLIKSLKMIDFAVNNLRVLVCLTLGPSGEKSLFAYESEDSHVTEIVNGSICDGH